MRKSEKKLLNLERKLDKNSQKIKMTGLHLQAGYGMN